MGFDSGESASPRDGRPLGSGAVAEPPAPRAACCSRGFTTAVALCAIMALALALRLLGAWCASLIFDERAHWALAATINFSPCGLHLVSRTLDHPLLSIYVLKLGSLLLGTSDFALRLPYVLAGTATILPVYFLGARAFSPKAGLWAAGLLAVDQFHVGWSRVFMPEVLMLLLVALAMLQFLRVLERGTTGNFVLLGVLLGLAYLAKEPAMLLVVALWIFALTESVTTGEVMSALPKGTVPFSSDENRDSPRERLPAPARRKLLRQPGWYLANAVFLLVIAPDIVWNATQWTESYLHRDAVLASTGQGLSLKPLSLYLGDWFRGIIGPNAFGEDYLEGNLLVCHAAAGALYLVAILAASRAWRVAAVRCLLIVFWLVFAVFLFLPAGGFYEPFWWASISLIPAVVCGGALMERLTHGSRLRTAIGLSAVALLAVNEAFVIRAPGRYEPRATVQQFVDDFTARGFEALDRNDLGEAEGRFVYVLNIGGPRADAYFGLARIAHQRGRPAVARRLLDKCLQLDPKHSKAMQWNRTIDADDHNEESSRGR